MRFRSGAFHLRRYTNGIPLPLLLLLLLYWYFPSISQTSQSSSHQTLSLQTKVHSQSHYLCYFYNNCRRTLNVFLAWTLEAAVMAREQFAFVVRSQLMNLQLVDGVKKLSTVITLHTRHTTAFTTTSAITESGRKFFIFHLAHPSRVTLDPGIFHHNVCYRNQNSGATSRGRAMPTFLSGGYKTMLQVEWAEFSVCTPTCDILGYISHKQCRKYNFHSSAWVLLLYPPAPICQKWETLIIIII